jgi:NADPH:quinone reductase-like Zn-dependent oxidoreductase
MKAVVQDRFGPPEVLQLADTEVPEVGADDVLVRVRSAALNPADWCAGTRWSRGSWAWG